MTGLISHEEFCRGRIHENSLGFSALVKMCSIAHCKVHFYFVIFRSSFFFFFFNGSFKIPFF